MTGQNMFAGLCVQSASNLSTRRSNRHVAPCCYICSCAFSLLLLVKNTTPVPKSCVLA